MLTPKIKIYDTLTRQKKEFVPLDPQGKKVNMYTCGVTVYDDCHIGHARSLYIFDVIRRYLKYRGFDVTFVRNITDIDDKIINRANELKIDWKELVNQYISRYCEDLAALGIEKADYEPRATENIPDMINYIESLIKKDYAYQAGQDVYFNVRKFPDYGKLSGQNIEQMQAGVRIEPTELKKDTLDFALWKGSKEGEPGWDSPWGRGRPGWHTECSVMSQRFLKTDTLDIHAGGRDLVFPHHENEIAQSEALTGKPFATHWIHHGLLTINGQKMAKSIGNFVTVKDFINKYNHPDLLKLFFLSAHYSVPIDYNQEKIEEVKKQKVSLDDFFELKYVPSKNAAAALISRADEDKVDKIFGQFEQAMDNDFNMPQALSYIFELRDLALSFINTRSFDYARAKMAKLFRVFNLGVKPQIEPTQDLLEQQYQRELARVSQNYTLADSIRKRLESSGYILEDHKGATAWRRKK